MRRNFFRLMLVFGVLICLIVIPQVVSADENGTFGENIQWSIDNVGVLTISGTGDMPEVSSPIDVPWNNYTNHVIVVNIEEGVTSVSDHAFNGFKELEYVSMPDSLKSIGTMAFRGCISLEELILSDGIENIESYAFYSCSFLTDLELSENLKTIGENAFSNCTSLEKIVIPDNVTYIGKDTFNSCSSIKEISIPFIGTELNPQNDYDKNFYVIFDSNSSNDVYYNNVPQTLKKVTVTNQESIPGDAFSKCINIEEVVIGEKTTKILDGAFHYCKSLKNVTIENENCELGNGLFKGCEFLSAFEFPNGVTEIGDSMFYGCTSLNDITIPDTVTVIGNSAFRDCTALNSINIPDNVTKIGKYAFYGCSNIDGIDIPNNVIEIGDFAFAELAKLETVIIPENVTTIGRGVFQGCNNIAEITLPFVGSKDDATGESAVFGYIFGYGDEYLSENCAQQFYSPSGYHCYFVPDSIKKVIITNDTDLHYGAFDDCENITEIILPDTLKTIGDYVFYDCKGLEKIMIPNGVTSVGANVFERCDNMSEVTFYSKEINISDACFDGCNITKIYGYANSDSEAYAIDKGIEFVPIEDKMLLTINAVNGTASGDGSYEKGSNVTVVATPNSGYKFKGWYLADELVSSEETYTFVLNEDMELTAKFSKKSSGGGGGGGGGGTVVKPPVKDEDDKQDEQQPTQPVTPVVPENENKPSTSNKFNDVTENDWYFEYVTELADKGIVSGDENGEFLPNDKVTREEFVKMLVLATGIELSNENQGFEDVNEDEWYAPYVNTAKANGIVNGVSEYKFGIGQPIIRQDMAVMIYNILPQEHLGSPVIALFKDDCEISDYAINAVYTMKKREIINGYEDGTFKPKVSLTRAEAAKIIYELLELL